MNKLQESKKGTAFQGHRHLCPLKPTGVLFLNWFFNQKPKALDRF